MTTRALAALVRIGRQHQCLNFVGWRGPRNGKRATIQLGKAFKVIRVRFQVHHISSRSLHICRYCYALAVKEGEHKALEGEEGEEEVSSARSSAEFVVAALWSPDVY